jgi:probable selenate reductase FAD-binding subunit
MSRLEYLRPKTIEEAMALMYRGIPIAGGTALVPLRSELNAVIDLSELGLESIRLEKNAIKIGSMTKLQAMAECDLLPAALREACHLEAGWNLRNMVSLAGVIMESDARSPLLTTLLAVDAKVTQAPGKLTSDLDVLLEEREKAKLITEISFPEPLALLHEQVARTPKDFPLVCAVMAKVNEDGEVRYRLTLGGFGKHPILVKQKQSASWGEGQMNEAVAAAKDIYQDAEDAWASAEYRSAISGVLVHRLLVAGGAQ